MAAGHVIEVAITQVSCFVRQAIEGDDLMNGSGARGVLKVDTPKSTTTIHPFTSTSLTYINLIESGLIFVSIAV